MLALLQFFIGVAWNWGVEQHLTLRELGYTQSMDNVNLLCIYRWNDPDNKAATDKVLSEVKGQFPQFSEGDIRGKF